MGSESHVTISVKHLLTVPCTIWGAHHLMIYSLPSPPSHSPPGSAMQHMLSRKGIIIMILHLEVQEEVRAPQRCRLSCLREGVCTSAALHFLSSAQWSPKRPKSEEKYYRYYYYYNYFYYYYYCFGKGVVMA